MRPGAAPVSLAPVSPAPVRATRATRTSKAASAAPVANGITTVMQRIREYVIADQDITINQILDRLVTEHLPDMTAKRASVATVRYDTLRTLTAVRAAGWTPPL